MTLILTTFEDITNWIQPSNCQYVEIQFSNGYTPPCSVARIPSTGGWLIWNRQAAIIGTYPQSQHPIVARNRSMNEIGEGVAIVLNPDEEVDDTHTVSVRTTTAVTTSMTPATSAATVTATAASMNRRGWNQVGTVDFMEDGRRYFRQGESTVCAIDGHRIIHLAYGEECLAIFDANRKRWSLAPDLSFWGQLSKYAAVTINGLLFLLIEWEFTKIPIDRIENPLGHEPRDENEFRFENGNGEVEIYSVRLKDPNTENWHHQATVTDDKYLYCFGGNVSRLYGRLSPPIATVERYDPESDTWEKLPDMKHKRDCCAAVRVKNKIYVMGGTTDSRTLLASVEIFDTTTLSWEEHDGAADLPGSLCQLSAVSIRDRWIVIPSGNFATPKRNPWPLKVPIIYDTDSKSWYRAACGLDEPRCGVTLATVLKFSSQIVVLGGLQRQRNEDSDECPDSVEMIDFADLYPNWEIVRPFALLRRLCEDGRAEHVPQNTTTSVIAVLVTELDQDMFQMILSFLLYRSNEGKT